MDWHRIDRLAPDWLIGTGLARALPFPRPFPHLTKEQVLYVGWSLVHSEDEFKTIDYSQFLPIHSSAGQFMPILDNQVPIPG